MMIKTTFIIYMFSLFLNINGIMNYIDTKELKTESSKINFSREFVYMNSIHAIDKEHNRLAWNRNTSARRIYKYFLYRMKPPHLSCGPRTNVLKLIFDKLGIRSRTVQVFKMNSQNFSGHVFLEVYDKEKKRWEIQDPDFNFGWILPDKPDEKLSVLELIKYRDKAMPDCGWNKNNKHLKDYFYGIVIVGNKTLWYFLDRKYIKDEKRFKLQVRKISARKRLMEFDATTEEGPYAK